MKSYSLNCLYVHDHKFKKNAQHFYSEGKMTDAVFSRYVPTDSKLTIISRMSEVADWSNLSQLTLPNLKFLPVKGLSFYKAFTAYLLPNTQLVMTEVTDSDFIVVRLPSFLGIYVLSINLLFRKRHFIEVVGDVQEALLSAKVKPGITYQAFTQVMQFLNGYFIKRADGVIYVTKYALQEKYPTQGLVSYASNVEVSVKDRDLKPTDYEVKNTVFKVGLIGSFNNPYKGIHEAITAVKFLRDKGYEAHLHILGSGSLQSHYETVAETLGVSDCIYFDGVLEGGDAVLSWLGTLDLYLQPSYSEGLPRALIEAMSVGLPAVATQVGGVPELIPQQHLIPPRDAAALAEQIASFMQSLTLRCQAGQQNYQTAQNYDQQVLSKRRAEFWQQARQLALQDASKNFLLFASYLPSVLKFRRNLLETIAESGYNIHILAPDLADYPEDCQTLNDLGYDVQSIPMQRTGTNPLADLHTFLTTYRLLRKLQPDHMLAYTIKPVIYGTLAAWLARVPNRYVLITGVGYVFMSAAGSRQRRLFKRLVHGLYRKALARADKIFFQNPDDLALFQTLQLIQPETATEVVNGSGVDVAEFSVMPFPRDDNGEVKPKFLLIARLLKDKGVAEYVEAAKRIKSEHPEAEFHLVGWIDENPTAISSQQLESWVAQDLVTYWGKLSDVRTAISACSAYVLPSYREGTPHTVLEAMAMGRPVITTDVPGCRETVIDGDNGYLVPVRAVDELVAAMRKFIQQPQLYQRMGEASRRLALAKYDVHKVNNRMITAMNLE